MELRQLRYLVALAQELSFTRASAKAHVAQPALSRQIRKLEDELGAALVDRTSRRVQLTSAGERLAEHAQVILDQVDSALDDILSLTDLTAGRLAIGATQTPGPFDISRAFSEFHQRYPAIELSVREELSVSIADRLRGDEIELGFVSEIPEAARRGLELRQIASEPFVIALPLEHRLAGARNLDFDELRGESFVVFPEQATIRHTLDELAQTHGVELNIAFVTTDTVRMCDMVARGFGVSLLPQSDAIRVAGRIATAALGNGQLMYKVYLARRRTRRPSPAARALIALIESISDV